jgi:hypothetical protein
VRLVSHTQKSGMPTDITGQKNVRRKAFLCTEWTKAHHRYRRHLSGVPTKLYLAFGTGDTFLVYQPSYIWRLVQGTPFWCTNQVISGVWYRKHSSGVPTKLYLAFGTGDSLPGYQPSYIWRLVQGMAFRGTNGGWDNSWYRKAASRVQ